MNSESSTSTTERSVLVRIPQVFDPLADSLIQRVGATLVKPLSGEYRLVKTAHPEQIRQSEEAMFLPWSLVLDHVWPCNPQKLEGFIEKAAQTLVAKFAGQQPQALFIGPLNGAAQDRFYHKLASNLRGRALQVFPAFPVDEVEAQDPAVKTLFCLVGREGLFAGLATPRECNGFYPGGSKYAKIEGPDVISRAGAKIVDALHHATLFHPLPAQGARWLELGACPGGMTSELLRRRYRVTALDPAPLDPRVMKMRGLSFVRTNVKDFRPSVQTLWDAMLCDMNGPPEEALAAVIRLVQNIENKGLVIFTLKLPRIESVDSALQMRRAVVDSAEARGLRLFECSHLAYNRHEFTMFFEHDVTLFRRTT